MCLPVVGVGDACTPESRYPSPETPTVSCPNGTLCHPERNVCESPWAPEPPTAEPPNPEPGPTLPPASYAGAGEPCDDEARLYCRAELFCSDADPEAPRCVPTRATGAPCEDHRECSFGDYCRDGVCAPPPGLGESCENFGCAGLNNYCDSTRRCSAAKPKGAACVPGVDLCEDELTCACSDSAPTCETPTCSEGRAGGQTCGEPGQACLPGTECRDGYCQPLDSLQGLFPTLCAAP